MKKYKDYYKILGVARDASYKTIKQAYRKRALTYHPDRNKASYAEARFKEINEAHEVLSDPKRRAAYDQWVRQEEEKRGAAEAAQAEQEGWEKEAKQREAEQAASPEQGSAPPDLVECPLCGKHNLKTNTFRCRQCGRDNLCLRHKDQHSSLCAFCESEKAGMQRKVESGKGGRKSASAAGWKKKARAGLVLALLCPFLGGGAWWMYKWRATTRLLEEVGYGYGAIERVASLEEVQRLVAAGADVNAREGHIYGRTALMFAVEGGNASVVKALLAAGADVNDKDSNDKTALMYAAEKLHEVEMVKILLAAGADVKAKDMFGRTALMNAAALFYVTKGEVNPEAVKVLLDAGAAVNAKDEDGRTALMWGVDYNSNPEAVRVLLAAGADVNSKDKDGRTALMRAVEENANSEVVRLLLAAGADVNTKDEEGKTALMFAKEKGHSEMIELLQAAGAKE